MKIKTLHTNKYHLNFNVRRKCVKMTFYAQFQLAWGSRLASALALSPALVSVAGRSPCWNPDRQALRWRVKHLGFRLGQAWAESLTYGLCDLSELTFPFCTMGIKDLLHKVVTHKVKMRENGAQGQGQCLVCIIPARDTPRTQPLPPPSTATAAG